MTILSGDIKLLASQRLDGYPLRWRRPGAGHEIVVASTTACFPTSAISTAPYGVVSLRKAFLAVQTDDTDTYRGASTIVQVPRLTRTWAVPDQHRGSSTTPAPMPATCWSAIWPVGPQVARLPVRHPAGRAAGDPLLPARRGAPAGSGETLVLVGNEGKAGEFEQYVRVLEVTQQLAKFQIPTCRVHPQRGDLQAGGSAALHLRGEQPTPDDGDQRQNRPARDRGGRCGQLLRHHQAGGGGEPSGPCRCGPRPSSPSWCRLPAAETPAVDLTAAGEMASLVDSGKGWSPSRPWSASPRAGACSSAPA